MIHRGSQQRVSCRARNEPGKLDLGDIRIDDNLQLAYLLLVRVACEFQGVPSRVGDWNKAGREEVKRERSV